MYIFVKYWSIVLSLHKLILEKSFTTRDRRIESNVTELRHNFFIPIKSCKLAAISKICEMLKNYVGEFAKKKRKARHVGHRM